MLHDYELIKKLKSLIEFIDSIPEQSPATDAIHDQIRELANDVRSKVLHKYPGKSSYYFSE